VSEPPAIERLHWSRLSVVVAVLFLLIGLVPLPQLIPGATGYWPEMARYWICATLLTLAPVAALAAMPLGGVRALPSRCAELLLRPSPLVFAGLVAVAVTVLAVGFSIYAYHRAPTTADEIAQLWQARILLHGRFSLPADPNSEFFAVDNVVDHGRWYSQFPVGGALMLVVGALIHAPWLVNPVLSGLTGAGLYHVTRRAFGELEGRATAVLYACSPSVLLMSATYMNHVPVLFLTVAALAALVQWERTATRTGRRTYAALLGLSLGCIAAIRPLDAVVVSLAIAACQVAVVRPKRTRRLSLLLQAIVGSLGVAVLLLGNWKTTGSPFRFGYEVLWGPASRMGFHVDPQGIPHTPLRALLLSIKYVGELNASLLGWPVPSILIVVLALLTLRRVTRWDALLLGLFAAQLFAYAFYWHDGEFLGPRYLYTALPTMIILVARAPFLVATRLGGYWRHTAPLLAMACVVVAWAVPMPPYGAWGMVRQAHDSASAFKLDIEGAVRANNIHHALALVHEPFSGRLMRRLWGVGMTRGDAARVFAAGDACSVLEAVRAAETDSASPPDLRATMVMTRVRPLARDTARVPASDPMIHISSEKPISPACQAELDEDLRYGGMPFGPALLLEPIGADGTLDGDVVYASDLGERNASLRPRFGARTWYRVWVEPAPDGSLRPVITRY
jgi:hypothetical protein